jgi:pimeloyl-[acyl-carrier protein] methyl ester esterase
LSVFVTPDGLKLHYQMTGRGKPLLFLHGWSMCSRVWRYQLEEFARTYQVTTLDLRGHGNSGSINGGCNFASLSQDIVYFIEGLHLQQLTLVGWSLSVALILKLLNAHALPVDSLVLIDGTPCFVSREDFPHGLPHAVVKRMIKRAGANFTRALGEFHGLLLSEKEDKDEKKGEIWDLLTNDQYLPEKETACDLLASLALEDLRNEVAALTLPTLLMHGDQDKICPVGASWYMKEYLGCAEIVLFPEAGHAPFLTQAEDFNEKMNTFLQSL